MASILNENMNQTYDLFLHTSHYMKFLLGEMKRVPKDEIPVGLRIVSEDLLKAINNFLGDCHTYNQNKSTAPANFELEEHFFENKNDPTSNSKSKRKEKSGVWITETFTKLVEDKVTTGNKEFKFYCRPCNVVVSSKRKRKAHVSTDEKHLSFMTNLNYKNQELSCTLCNISVLGSFSLIVKYMNFHNEIHLADKTADGVVFDKKTNLPKYIKFVNELGLNVSNLSKSNSLSSSTTSVVSVNSKSEKEPQKFKRKNKQVHKERQMESENFNSNTNQHSAEYSEPKPEFSQTYFAGPNVNENYNPQDEVAAEHAENPVKTSCNSGNEIFVEMIEEVIKYFKKTSSKLSATFCIVCNQFCLSGFEWIDHGCSDLHVKNATETCELIACKHCGISLFGESDQLQKLSDNIEHYRLDKFFGK